ncbi:hypothetical protein [Isoptericola sp. b408]|uniref:hypothetical protein n=1 Tax=Isoptericola sp. b408 TaxID=3064653 RepID=UPI0027126F89|nr:hypothetical protein [Isoptericola sp. b408]MDO8151710.1 hypothetical protein [Isoptericola sp. b408]
MPGGDEWDQFKAKYKAAVKDLDATGDGSAAVVEAKQADRRRAAQILRDTGEYPTDPTPNYDAVVARRNAARAFLDTAQDQASLISADYHREYLTVAADPTWQTQHDQARANVHTAAQALIDAIVQADEVDEMATWATTGQPFNSYGSPPFSTRSAVRRLTPQRLAGGPAPQGAGPSCVTEGCEVAPSGSHGPWPAQRAGCLPERS